MVTRPDSLSPRMWIRLIVVYLFIPLVLFLSAGDWGWWQAWVYAVLILVTGIGGRVWAEHRHPGLLVERSVSESAEGVKPWDKILAPLMAVSSVFPLLIVAGLDHRFAWSPEFPLWLNLLGLALIALGYAFGTWALAENRFFSGTVRIQTERGHAVCDSGPYRVVRHPGYAGNVIPLPGMVLAFSSLWTIVPALAALVVVVVRTGLEDRTLQKELAGYPAYARQVRYRLFPGIY